MVTPDPCLALDQISHFLPCFRSNYIS